MKTDIKRLTVLYNQIVVGYLADIGNGDIAFQYDLDWIATGFPISPITLPLSDKVYITNTPYFNGLYAVFNDSLPDGWGEYLLRRKLLKMGVNFDRLSPLSRLTLISKSGLGALEYVPTQSQKDILNTFTLDELYEQIKAQTQGQTDAYHLDTLYRLGGASGGARPKVHVNINDEDWIIKFKAQIDPVDVGYKEFMANQLAKDCGINVAAFKLFDSKLTKGYFGSKRFDRIDEKKQHVISLSAILETTHRISNLDYKHLFQVIQRISVDKEDYYEAFRRMTFNVLYGNKDDHGKNHAFVYDEEKRGYVLSKAYDITKTHNQLEHEMTVNGQGNPTVEDLMSIQQDMKLDKQRCIEIIKHTKMILDKDKTNNNY